MKFLIGLFLCASSIACLFSQMPSSNDSRTDKKISFVPVPYISYDRSQGGQFGALPMVMYNLSKKDTISPSSTSGALGMYTTENTWFAMIFNKWYLKEDKYRVLMAAGLGDFNFQFYSDNEFSPGFVNYSTGTSFAVFEVQRKVYQQLYIGGRYMFLDFNTVFEVADQDVETSSKLNGLGLVMAYDLRDNVYYPKKGYQANLKYLSFPGFINDNISNKLELDFDWYKGIGHKERDVIAVRLYAGAAIGDLDFNQQFIVGGADIRGYSQGAFRGNQIIALQSEYRWNLTDDFGLVGFGGLATIFNAVNESDNGKLLPGAGGGFRVNVFPKNHMNVGLDGALGLDDWTISFQIGEAF